MNYNEFKKDILLYGFFVERVLNDCLLTKFFNFIRLKLCTIFIKINKFLNYNLYIFEYFCKIDNFPMNKLS